MDVGVGGNIEKGWMLERVGMDQAMLDQRGEGEPSLPRVLDLPAGVRVTSVAMKVSSGYHRKTWFEWLV